MVNNRHLLRLRKASCIIWSNCFWDLITVILLPPSVFCTASKIRRWEVCVRVRPCVFLLSTWDKEAVIGVRGSHHYPRDSCSWQELVPSWKEAISIASPQQGNGGSVRTAGDTGRTGEGCHSTLFCLQKLVELKPDDISRVPNAFSWKQKTSGLKLPDYKHKI